MEQLNDVRTVRPDTVKQIVEIARKDPHAREYVVQKLPDLIGRPESDVWLDAIRLAGKLKAKEAIPALQQAMSRRPFPLRLGGLCAWITISWERRFPKSESPRFLPSRVY